MKKSINEIKIFVNGIDVTYCEHFRFRNNKEFSCKKGTYECTCNPHNVECERYVNSLKEKIINLEHAIQILENQLAQENCNFDKIKDLTND